MRRVYQRQMKPRLIDGKKVCSEWEDIRLKDLNPGFPVAPAVKGGPFGRLSTTLRRLEPGEHIYTLRCRYRVVLA